MAPKNRPKSRDVYVTNDSKGVSKRPSGSYSSSGGSGPSRGAMIGGGLSLPVIIIIILLNLLGGQAVSPSETLYQNDSANWAATPVSKPNTAVADGSRNKFTDIAGNGEDIITLMVYMCGTDLESRSSMATNDLKEMMDATLSDKINLLVYTGGCSRWQNSLVSSRVNQIYKVENGGLRCLVNDDGDKSLTSPDTLTSFIKWSAANYPANRYELIFWDHGGGSVSGYGYDEKHKNSGSMSLSGINTALKNSGISFDMIGFDACLMATAENALMLEHYGDYLVASEETEPGIGWYYTKWLNKLSKDTSMPTLDLAANIIDDYTSACQSYVPGQKTTLSVIDLAEFANTVPDRLNSFSQQVSGAINTDYASVSSARYHTREFAQSSRIDQVDLVNLAENMNSPEGEQLADVLKEAVKYNRTSSNMTNAYGVSIYFPQQRKDYVEAAADNYEDIGMDSDYTACIRAFASTQSQGQTTTSSQDISNIFYLLTGARSADSINSQNGSISGEELVWKTSEDGKKYISLSEDEWSSILSLDLSMYYDDGEGYFNLGLDNVFSFDDDGNLLGDIDRTWLAINGQPVCYYHTDTTETDEGYTITGYVPVLLNDQEANLIIVFDNEEPKGYIAGVQYCDAPTDTVSKSLTDLENGDRIDFICPYYNYNGQYEEDAFLGEPMIVSDNMRISNVDVGNGAIKALYRFTDIYDQHYWTEVLE